ncbi:eCIS core domain-containing protein [Nostoc sp.]|uniref:eCIS core domain-containing protein n=1 Tax=Nostoc sp. TaxID=1180 RepID=UPI002FFA4300
MREQVNRQKKTTTGFSIPSLKNPIHGFGLESSAISRQAVPEIQPLHKPLTHDISRIPLRTQAKLSISQPGDIYEQEADSVAQQVMQRMAQPVNRQSIQREALPEEEEELQMKPLEISTLQRQEMPEDEEELQMKSLDNRTLQRQEVPEDEEELQMKPMAQRQAEAGIAAAPDLEASINQARGGGQAIADNIREPMEQAFGADFSGVKVHTDGQSDQLNQSIQARAFTTGQDVFFRQGEYNPGSRGGQELLAHELTHVVQQNGGAVMRSPLPPQQLSQHTAIVSPSASIADRAIQGKVAITGNSQISSLAQPGCLQMVPWNSANTTAVGGLSSSLNAGYALATASPNARPAVPPWVTNRVAADNPWNDSTERAESDKTALDAWNRLPKSAQDKIPDEITWKMNRSDKDYNNRMTVHHNQWPITAAAKWLTASWNAPWNNNDSDLPGLAGAGGYAEYYAEPTGAIAAEGFWGRNRIVRDTTGAGPHANHWWATSDHYNNFTRVT